MYRKLIGNLFLIVIWLMMAGIAKGDIVNEFSTVPEQQLSFSSIGICDPTKPISSSSIIGSGSNQAAQGCNGTTSSTSLTCSVIGDFQKNQMVSYLGGPLSVLATPGPPTVVNTTIAFREGHVVPAGPNQVTVGHAANFLSDINVVYINDKAPLEPMGLQLSPNMVSPTQQAYNYIGGGIYQFANIDFTSGSNVGITYSWQDNTGATTHSYVCGAEDASGGLSPAGQATVDTTANAALGWLHYPGVTCPAVTGAVSYYFYRDGAYLERTGMDMRTDTVLNTINDIHQVPFQQKPWYYPSTPPSAATAQIKTSTVMGVSSGVVTLDTPPATSVSNVIVRHNDSVAIQNCIDSFSVVSNPNWVGGHNYNLGDKITDGLGNVQTVTTAGGSSSIMVPNFATALNATTIDNTVVWTLTSIATYGGIVQLKGGVWNANVRVKAGVALQGASPYQSLPRGSTWHHDTTTVQGIIPNNPTILIDVPSSVTNESFNISVNSLMVRGLGSGPNDFGITTGKNGYLERGSFYNLGIKFTGEAGLHLNGTGVQIDNIYIGDSLQNQTGVMDRGGFEFGGADSWISRMEASGPNDGGDTPSSPFLYNNACLLAAGNSNFVNQVLCEFGDNNLRVMAGRAITTDCSVAGVADCLIGPGAFNRLPGLRSDYAFGNGVNLINDQGRNDFTGAWINNSNSFGSSFCVGPGNPQACCTDLRTGTCNKGLWDEIYKPVVAQGGGDFGTVKVYSSGSRFAVNDMSTNNPALPPASWDQWKIILQNGAGWPKFGLGSMQYTTGALVVPVSPSPVGTLNTDHTQPDITGTTNFWAANSPNPTTIIRFQGGDSGQDLFVFGDGYTSIANRAVATTVDGGIVTFSGKTFLTLPSTIYHFKKWTSLWYQVVSGVNGLYQPSTSSANIVQDLGQGLQQLINIVDASAHTLAVANDFIGQQWRFTLANSSGGVIPTPLLTPGMRADASFINPPNGTRINCNVSEITASDIEIGPCSGAITVPTPAATAVPLPTSTPSPTFTPTATPTPNP